MTLRNVLATAGLLVGARWLLVHAYRYHKQSAIIDQQNRYLEEQDYLINELLERQFVEEEPESEEEQPSKPNPPISTMQVVPDNTIPTTENQPAIDPQSKDDFPLQLGSTGPRVKRLQIWLMKNHGLLPVTGELDEETHKKMRSFLKVDALTEALYNKHKMGEHVQDQRRKKKK